MILLDNIITIITNYINMTFIYFFPIELIGNYLIVYYLIINTTIKHPKKSRYLMHVRPLLLIII